MDYQRILLHFGVSDLPLVLVRQSLRATFSTNLYSTSMITYRIWRSDATTKRVGGSNLRVCNVVMIWNYSLTDHLPAACDAYCHRECCDLHVSYSLQPLGY